MDTTKPVLDFYSGNENFHEIDGSEENSRSVSPSDIDWDIVVQEDFDAFSK